jgi:ring-1,2-phenylacetyl-CoA epoxidase subunit PaaD
VVSAVPTSVSRSEAAVWAALEDVKDPEIPAVSVVELGVVHTVDVSAERVRVELMPTFVGCPALDFMRQAVRDRLAGFAPAVDVDITFAEPWTSDRITPAGRRKLRESGFAPPSPLGVSATSMPILLGPPAECPFCGSRRTVMENAFGPTQCRAIHYCTACRQPFEGFKAI